MNSGTSQGKNNKLSRPDDGFNIAKLEKEVLEFWDKNRIFESSLEKTKNGKPFTFYDGPPFATGLPHYGHILASTIKDVIPRYQTMKGRFVRRRWGWDCHGLPIEEIVERKLGISGKKQIEKIGVKKFNETCRSMVLEYANEWEKMIRRVARWVEFKNSYKTMDADYMESVWWAFKQIHDKNLVYEGRKVLLYCPRCETPVSNFEVAMDNSYRDVTEESVTVKFHLKPEQKLGKEYTTQNSAYILSWTTTPWTLPGNVALAVGKDIAYTALRVRGIKELYIVASSLAKKVFKDKEIEIVYDDISGKDLVGLEYKPLFDVPAVASDKAFRVYDADFVTTDEGTGIVHTAVVYGEDDFELGVKNGLPVVPLLDEKGMFNEKAPEFLRGVYFKDSEKIIKDDLLKRGLLFGREMHEHSYPYCWRCGNALFYNAIPAWFINIQKIKTRLLESNNREINWFPSHLKHGRYEKSVESAPDWNISRNRYWGNPIPVWKCDKCLASPDPAKRDGAVKVIGSLEELSKKAGGSKNKYWTMRHGEAKSNLGSIIDSGGDESNVLTAKGIKDAKLAAEKFLEKLHKEKKKIDVVIASDITRAKQTAKIVSGALGAKDVIFDKRLRELNLGELNGCHDGKYHELFPTYEEKFNGAPRGGETLRDLRKRVWNFIESCEGKYAGKNILIISHEYTIWIMNHAALGWSEEKAIEEKKKRGEFISTAGLESLAVKIIPRSDSGEVDLHRPYIDEVNFVCASCGGIMKRTPEIFDSWMEAGSMPFAEYHYPFENKDVFESRFPAQFVAEYIAQTRAWFYVMHVISLVIFGKAPFLNVVTTGTILAEDGSKMSKSKENFPDPWRVIEKYGADSLRFYLMNSVVMQADNLNFSEKILEGIYRKVGLLLLNVYKYFSTYSPSEISANDRIETTGGAKVLDLWIKTKGEELVEKVTAFLDAYDTVHATRAIQEYVDDLSTWYLRRSRKRRDSIFFETLRESLVVASRVAAPFMPFLADMLYRELERGDNDSEKPDSVHLTKWPETGFSLKKEERGKLTENMAEVRYLASLGLAKRAEAKIKTKQPLAAMMVRSAKLKSQEDFLEILAAEVNVKRISFDDKLKGEAELDTALTPELREEGLLRELVRAIQDLRQKAGLKPGEGIDLFMRLPEAIQSVAVKNEKELKDFVSAKSVEYRTSGKFDAEADTKITEYEVWLGVRKVNG